MARAAPPVLPEIQGGLVATRRHRNNVAEGAVPLALIHIGIVTPVGHGWPRDLDPALVIPVGQPQRTVHIPERLRPCHDAYRIQPPGMARPDGNRIHEGFPPGLGLEPEVKQAVWSGADIAKYF